MKEEVSKKTVLVLLLLTVVVSGIGTWIALDSVNNMPTHNQNSQTAHLRVAVNVPQVDRTSDSISGHVSMNILPNNN